MKILNVKCLFILLTAIFSLCMAPQSAHATWSLVQHPRGACNVSSPCSLTVTATGTGHLGILIFLQAQGAAPTLSSVSDGTSTWTVNGTCSVTNGGIGGVFGAYSVNLASGITSISATLSAGTAFNGEVEFLEYSTTGGPPIFDTCAGTVNGSSATPAGQVLTLSGTNDVIVQVIQSAGPQNATAVTGTYTNPADFPFSGPAAAGYGIAGSINTSSGTAPTWTLNGANTSLVIGMAFKESVAAGSRFVGIFPSHNGSSARLTFIAKRKREELL